MHLVTLLADEWVGGVGLQGWGGAVDAATAPWSFKLLPSQLSILF